MTFVYINLAASALNIASACLVIYSAFLIRKANRLNRETAERLRAAQVDTHAERGDVEQAPSLMGSAVPATSGDAS